MKETEKAWLAAMIDGEGCISIARLKPRWKLRSSAHCGRAKARVTGVTVEHNIDASSLKQTIHALNKRGAVDDDEVIEMPVARTPEPTLFAL